MKHEVIINDEAFRIATKDDSAKYPWFDFNYLEHWWDGEWHNLKSQTLRDLFWNRYMGAVAAQIRGENEKN